MDPDDCECCLGTGQICTGCDQPSGYCICQPSIRPAEKVECQACLFEDQSADLCDE